MPPYRLAKPSHDQLMAIEGLENELGLTLIAYEPTEGRPVQNGDRPDNAREEFAYLDAVEDLYEHFDPHI